jgi:hypothetical protein
MTVTPSVRYLIVCDEVLPDPQRPGKLLIVGLTTLIGWPADGTAPVRLEKLTVLLILTDGRGTGTVQIVCRDEETEDLVFGSPPARISFEGKDPTAHHSVTFNLLDCPFPAPGVYLVQFLFEGALVQEQTVTVR